MAEIKTRANDNNVIDFIESVESEQKKKDSYRLLEIMKKLSGVEPKMWGKSIIGFGDIHLKYESGREVDWFKVGFSPRKNAISFYSLQYYDEQSDLLKRLGKHKHGKSCIYINKFSDINEDVLEELINNSLAFKGSL